VDFGFETMNRERRFLAVAAALLPRKTGTLLAAWRCRSSI
jgi:hypothetical protein